MSPWRRVSGSAYGACSPASSPVSAAGSHLKMRSNTSPEATWKAYSGPVSGEWATWTAVPWRTKVYHAAYPWP